MTADQKSPPLLCLTLETAPVPLTNDTPPASSERLAAKSLVLVSRANKTKMVDEVVVFDLEMGFKDFCRNNRKIGRHLGRNADLQVKMVSEVRVDLLFIAAESLLCVQ